MRFLVDESAGRSIIHYLRSAGHNVASVQEKHSGIKDREICDWSIQEGRIIITNDKDFGKLVFHKRLKNRGVILLRLEDENASNKVRVISNLLKNYEERLKDNFVVISEDKVRIRPLPFPSKDLE